MLGWGDGYDQWGTDDLSICRFFGCLGTEEESDWTQEGIDRVGNIYRFIYREINIRIDGQTGRPTYRQIERQTDRQTRKYKTDRQASRKTGR